MLRIDGSEVIGFYADGTEGVAAYVDGEEVWIAGDPAAPTNVTDDFDREDNATIGDNYTTLTSTAPRISSNQARPTTANVYIAAKRNDITFSTNNHKTSLIIGGFAADNPVLPIVRASVNRFVWVFMRSGSNPIIYTSTSYSPFTTGQVSRATGASIGLAAGDVVSLEAIGKFYISRKNGAATSIWYDSANAYPYANSNHRDVVLGLRPNYTNRGVDSATWEDLPANLFHPSRMTKSGTQAWTSSASWSTITSWSATNTANAGVPEYTSFISSNALVVIGNKAGASLSASVPFTGSTAERSHAIRIVRASDRTVVATGNPVVGTDGTCTVSTTRNVFAGESYRVEMQSDGSSAGTITSTTPEFSIS